MNGEIFKAWRDQKWRDQSEKSIQKQNDISQHVFKFEHVAGRIGFKKFILFFITKVYAKNISCEEVMYRGE